VQIYAQIRHRHSKTRSEIAVEIDQIKAGETQGLGVEKLANECSYGLTDTDSPPEAVLSPSDAASDNLILPLHPLKG
jgi:hypothetical protein